jgi:hypothetical protein
MEIKEFDCVEIQRKIRDDFWKASGENVDIMEKIIDDELEKSELYKIFKSRLIVKNSNLIPA